MLNLVVADAATFAALVSALDQFTSNEEDAIALGDSSFDARRSAVLTAAYRLIDQLNTRQAHVRARRVLSHLRSPGAKVMSTKTKKTKQLDRYDTLSHDVESVIQELRDLKEHGDKLHHRINSAIVMLNIADEGAGNLSPYKIIQSAIAILRGEK